MIGGQYRMKKPYQIVVLAPMLHRDPAVWGERAEVFDPDHFSREAERGRPANAYKPFGNGQRACIGRQFALQEAALVLGMVLQRFKLIDHTRYRLKLKETLTLKPDGFRIKVRRRTDRDRARPAARAAARSIGARRAVAAAGVRGRPAPRHAAAGALRLEPRHRRGGGPPDRPSRARRAASRSRWRRSTSTRAACPPTARWSSRPPRTTARRPTTRRASASGCAAPTRRRRARGRALHRVRLRQPRLGVHLPGGPPADRRAARRARGASASTPAARATRARTSTGSSRPGTSRCGGTLAKALGVELAAARGGGGRRISRSRRCRRRRREPLRGRRSARARCGSR